MLLYKVKQFVHQRSILAVYYSYIHSDLDYANIVYGSKKDKLKKILTEIMLLELKATKPVLTTSENFSSHTKF